MFHFSFTVAQLILGLVYAYDCPIDPKIPHYLFVSGSVALTDIILAIIVGILMVVIVKPAVKAAAQEREADDHAIGIICSIICCIITVLSFLGVFMMGWTIAGLIWLFDAWNKVQYVKPNMPDYCHPTLYRFTYWSFILPFALALVLCCCPCCMVCFAFFKTKNKLVQRVPTSEP
jgi:hypothetical protein